jgi:membrane protein DedA with SNARE-associated domain
MERVTKTFERWGFGAIAIPALLPPPVPMIPFVLAAGATKYSLKKFLLAMTLGRLARYSMLAVLAARYGRGIIRFIHQHGHPVVLSIIGVVAIVAVIFLVLHYGKKGARTRSPKQRAIKSKA